MKRKAATRSPAYSPQPYGVDITEESCILTCQTHKHKGEIQYKNSTSLILSKALENVIESYVYRK